jgi:hypothetical protein
MAGEQAFDVEAAIAALEAQKANIEETINALRRYQGTGVPAGSSTAGRTVDAANIPDDAFFGLSIGEGAKKYLAIVKRKQSMREIAEALDRGGLQHASGDFVATVATMLRRHAVKDAELVRVGRGDWGLAAWYGNRRPTSKSGPKRKSKTRGPGRPAKHPAGASEAPVKEMAREVIRQHGSSLSVDAITEQIKKRFSRDVSKQTLVGALSRGVRDGIFSRPGTSVYGVIA